MDKKEFYYQKIFNSSFLDKIKEKIAMEKLKEPEVKAMKLWLLDEAKPIFLEFLDSTEPILPESYVIPFRNEKEYLEYYFDERIKTLPKQSVYKLYKSFLDYKKSIGTNDEDSFHKFLIYMKFLIMNHSV